MTGEPRDPHSVSAFMTTGMLGGEGLQMGGPPGRAELGPRCTGTCLRPRRTTSPRWQSVESALDHVRLGSRTKTALNSSTEMQEMLLCPSGMFPGESDAFPLPSTAFQGSVIGPFGSFSVAISLCFSSILFFWGFPAPLPQHSRPRYPAYRARICLLAQLHCLWSSRSFQTPDEPHRSCLHYHFR